MTDVVIARSPADSAAAERMLEHHAAMSGRLAASVDALVRATSAEEAYAARDALVRWAQEELLPHAAAEETSTYEAARTFDNLAPLVDSLLSEHVALASLVTEIGSASRPLQAVQLAGGLKALFDVHVAKENDIVMPALLASPDHSMADLLEQMHEGISSTPAPATASEPDAGGCGGHSCACGESGSEGYPELDARSIPHDIRHATIFGALDSVRPGEGMVLVAPHDPLPLLAQLEQRAPGAFEISYLERGPEAWRLELVRVG